MQIKSQFNKILFLAVVLTLLWVPLSHAKSPKAKALRVGISPTSPPIRFMDRNEMAGLEVDFAKGLGKELGRPVEFIPLKFEKLIPELLDNRIDIIMSGMSITPIRSLQIAFASPYIKVGQMALVRQEDAHEFSNPRDVILTKTRVGTKEHTTGEFLLVRDFPHAKKRFFSTQAKGARALKKKKIDMLVLDSPYTLWLASKSKGKLAPVPIHLTEENLAWGVRKSDTQFLESINLFLSKWTQTGQKESLIKKWIPESQPASELEHAYLVIISTAPHYFRGVEYNKESDREIIHRFYYGDNVKMVGIGENLKVDQIVFVKFRTMDGKQRAIVIAGDSPNLTTKEFLTDPRYSE